MPLWRRRQRRPGSGGPPNRSALGRAASGRRWRRRPGGSVRSSAGSRPGRRGQEAGPRTTATIRGARRSAPSGGGSGGPHGEAAPGCDPHVRRLARRQPGPADEPCGRGAGAEARRHEGLDAGPVLRPRRGSSSTRSTPTPSPGSGTGRSPGIREHHELLESGSASLVPAVRGADRRLPCGRRTGRSPTCSGSLAMSD